ncbi:MAG: osmoprotectant transporter activator [Candidatus Accumulibacter sp.]|nr:osmoprotectant transporter activator [Accumulibacter sp.]
MTTPIVNPAPLENPHTLLKQLQQRFPVFRDALPLAIGIDKQILARHPEINRKTLRIALGMHTHSLRYLKAMEKATIRHHLDGETAGEVPAEHRQHAMDQVRERLKKQAEQRKTQREADTIARKRAEKLDQLVEKFGRNR